MIALRATALLAAAFLTVVWIMWRGPVVAREVHYALATPWPAATELALASDGTIALGERRVAVDAGMGVDCMPSVRPLPLPVPDCRGPGFAAELSATDLFSMRALPHLRHARVESEGAVFETDLVELARGRNNDTFIRASADREPSGWTPGRALRVTLWIEHDTRLYRVELPPRAILKAV